MKIICEGEHAYNELYMFDDNGDFRLYMWCENCEHEYTSITFAGKKL